MTELLAGLVLGLASSAHCAAMCGPLMLAWRGHAASAREPRALLLYHIARLGMYAAFGAAAGWVGGAVGGGNVARGISITGGLLLLATAVGRTGVQWPFAIPRGMGAWIGRGLARARRLGSTCPAAAAMVAGALNALLPCGLLYAAVLAAAAVADPWRSAAATAMYGVGTTPALAAIWWSAGPIARLARGRLALVTPLVLAFTGALLIGRGLMPTHAPTPRSDATAAAPLHRH